MPNGQSVREFDGQDLDVLTAQNLIQVAWERQTTETVPTENPATGLKPGTQQR